MSTRSYLLVKPHCDDLSLDDSKLDNVPGTELLSAKNNQLIIGETSELKRGTGKYSHIVLIPQPSDDPRDPCVMRSTSTAMFKSLTSK